MRVVVVYNSNSGSAIAESEIRKKCSRNGIELIEAIAVRDGYEQKLKDYIKEGITILVIGGDGTISSVAQYALNSKAMIAPLPGGTLNHFTKDLGINQDLDEAFSSLAHAKSRLVDVGMVNGQVFINNSSIGLYPSTVQERRRSEVRMGKWLSAVIASVSAFVRFHRYSIEINGENFKTPFVFVGNNMYVINADGITRPKMDEGILSVFIVKNVSRSALLRIALLALVGVRRSADEFEISKVRKMTIKTAHSRLHVARDGEVTKLSAPLEYHIETKKLRILM